MALKQELQDTKPAPKVKKFKPPAEWSDPLVRDNLASSLKRMIDDAQSDSTIQERMERYKLAQKVFDDEEVMTKIDLGDDFMPFQLPLTRRQVNGAARTVASQFNGADPFYIFKGGDDSKLRDAREKDTQLLLEADSYKNKVRDSARIAAIWARGIFRIKFEVKDRGEGWVNPKDIKDSDIVFAGPARESILPEDFIFYPLTQQSIVNTRMVGHRFDRPMYEVWQMQDDGDYFDKETLEIQPYNDHNTPTTEVENYALDLYHLIVKTYPGEDKKKPMKAYRVVLGYSQEKILAISEYTLPMPEYFAPGFFYDPNAFWPTHSLASSMAEIQCILNDAMSIRIWSGAANVSPNTFISGYMPGEETTFKMGIGTVLLSRGNPTITRMPPSPQAGGDLENICAEMVSSAEAVTGFSTNAAGGVTPHKVTATETAQIANGVSEEGEEKRTNFMEEELRFVRFIQTLVAIPENFEALKKFYGDRWQTKGPADWEAKFEIAPNGQGLNNNPQTTIQKLEMMVQTLPQLGIPKLDDVRSGAAPNTGVAIDTEEVARVLVQNLDFPFSTDKILVDTTNEPTPPPQPVPEQQLGLPGQDASSGGIPPEFLHALLAGGAGIPGPMDAGTQGGEPQLPPEIMQLLLGAGAGGALQGPM